MTKKVLNNKKFLSALVAFAIIAVAPIGILNRQANAVGNSVYISPSSSSMPSGTEFTVDVKANSSTFDSAQVDVTYSASSIDYLGYNLSGTAFPTPLGLVTSSGSFSITLFGVYPPNLPSGDVSLLKLSFRSKVSSGTGAISVANTSGTFHSGVNLTTSRSGSTLTFTSPPASMTAPTTPQQASAITNQSSSTPTKTNTGSQNTNQNTGSIKTKSNEPKLATASNPNPSTTAEQVKNDPLLAPQDVKAIISIKDLSGKLVRNTTIKINDNEYKTDKNGKVTFEGKTYGVLTVTYSKDSKQIPLGKVTLVKGATDSKYEIIANENIASPSDNSLPILPGIVSALLIAVGIFCVIRIYKIRQDRKSMALHGLGGGAVGIEPVAQQPAQSIQPIISSEAVTTTNPSATVITPMESTALSNEDIAEIARNIVEDK